MTIIIIINDIARELKNNRGQTIPSWPKKKKKGLYAFIKLNRFFSWQVKNSAAAARVSQWFLFFSAERDKSTLQCLLSPVLLQKAK